MTKDVWYVKEGSDKGLIKPAILLAEVTGSIGATESIAEIDGTVRAASVLREGHQEDDYYLFEG